LHDYLNGQTTANLTMKLLQLITIIAGIVMSLGYYPQAYKIWKLKSAKEISLVNYIILSLGTVIWLLYGIIMSDWVITIGFGVSVIGSWLVLFLAIRYKNKKG